MRMSYIFLFAVMQCSAQLFPFSNLRQYLEQQWKGSEYGMAHVPRSEQSSARPYRHTDIPHILSIPAISESFDLIDGFSKNNKEDQERLPIKRENNNAKKETVKLPTRRIQVRGNQKIRKQQPEPTDEVLVTPRPHVKPEQTYTKTKPTKAVQLVQESGDIPLSVQTTQHVVSTVKTGIDPEQLFVTPSSTQGKPTLVESIPSLTFAVQPTNNFVRHGGLVDYLTPPKLPSVYNLKQPFRLPENYFSDSREDDIPAEMSRLKPPPEDPPKKEKHFITKKYKNDSVKSTPNPVAERHTVAPKKQLAAETTRHVRRRPANKIELSPAKKAELLEAGSQMNEQVILNYTTTADIYLLNNIYLLNRKIVIAKIK